MAAIDRDLISNKPSCYIFDIDGVMADISEILLTHEQSFKVKTERYEKALEEYNKEMVQYNKAVVEFNKARIKDQPAIPIAPIRPAKANASQQNKIDWEYFYSHAIEATPIPGIIDVFANLAATHKVAILTHRSELSRTQTIEWLKKVIVEKGGDDLYRRINFQLIMATDKESQTSAVKFKKEKVLELAKQYNIPLIFEDNPDIIAEYTKLGFLVLSPNREYLRVGDQGEQKK